MKVINFYLSLIMEQCSGESRGLKVYSFSTFFFPKLQGGGGGQPSGHAAVKRWTKAVDIFLFDLILVPLHLGVHWAIAVSHSCNDCKMIYRFVNLFSFKSLLISGYRFESQVRKVI